MVASGTRTCRARATGLTCLHRSSGLLGRRQRPEQGRLSLNERAGGWATPPIPQLASRVFVPRKPEPPSASSPNFWLENELQPELHGTVAARKLARVEETVACRDEHKASCKRVRVRCLVERAVV